MSRKTTKPYLKMSLEELRSATREYDDPDYRPKNLPKTPEEQARIERTLRNLRRGYRPGVRGRAPVGKGARRVLITVEARLLDQADAFARRAKMSRSELIARSLTATLAGTNAA
ncbi:MAG: hypothetical protein ABSH20_11485 [Tepidisphaeraceae bacterium]|jgi:hypothetical protein